MKLTYTLYGVKWNNAFYNVYSDDFPNYNGTVYDWKNTDNMAGEDFRYRLWNMWKQHEKFPVPIPYDEVVKRHDEEHAKYFQISIRADDIETV